MQKRFIAYARNMPPNYVVIRGIFCMQYVQVKSAKKKGHEDEG